MTIDNETARTIEKLFQLKEKVNPFTDTSAVIAVKLHDELECMIVSGLYLGPVSSGPVSDEYAQQARKSILSRMENNQGIPHYWGYHPRLESFIDIAVNQFCESNGLLLIPQDDKRIVYPNERKDPKNILEVSEIYILGGLVRRRFLPSREQLPERYLEYLRTHSSSLPSTEGRGLKVSV